MVVWIEKYRSVARMFVSGVLFSLIISCSDIDHSKIVFGEWSGSHKNHSVIFILNDDYSCSLSYYEEDSKDYITLSGQCLIDFSKRPYPITIDNIQQLNYSLHSIFEFSGSDKIKISEFSNRWKLRPISFEKGKTIILERVKKEK